MKKYFILFSLLFFISSLFAQNIKWSKDGAAYFRQEKSDIVRYDLPDKNKTVILTKEQLIPAGKTSPLNVRNYFFSDDNSEILIYTNSKRVWRYDTRGDYWVYDTRLKTLKQLGIGKPESSLMFAKISPDGKNAAYVSEHNLFVENLSTNAITQLTSTNGTKKLINGTFDWVYEEEFDCRDGFRWSPDSKKIAYWQIDANKIKDFLMINNTDSIYPFTVPVEYPKVGEMPSPYKIGVADINSGKTTWMNIEGDPQQTYLPRMEWIPNSDVLLMQQLNRKQNVSKLITANAKSGETKTIYEETDPTWVDLRGKDPVNYFDWINNNKEFVWESEKDGWRHLYKVSRDGKNEQLITKGDFDVIDVLSSDEANGYVYYTASPNNATQKYLYRSKLDGKGNAELLNSNSETEKGTHNYVMSPNGKFAVHTFSNYYTERETDWISLPDNKPLEAKPADKIANTGTKNKNLKFFQVTTADNVTMDGWMVLPDNFDSTKKYPIVYYVYSEPAGATVNDVTGIGSNRLYTGNMAADGYIYASLDGRGTPAPKGRAWRKAIYRKIGIVNIRDQAMGATEMFKRWSWIDTSRVAIWGWSGGAAATLNCLFQYPDIYKTGIAIASITNQLTYDNIYQERYMGLPQENREDFITGSPVTYAKNLRGNLLYIHGTGDDNVHYQNAEILLNELIKYNKQFQFMAYPNRSHGIYEGEGTSLHLATLYTAYLKAHCAPGAK